MHDLVERVRMRCTDFGDCWEWQGALQSGGSTPTMRIGKETIGVRRALLQLKGTDLSGKVATYKCGNTLCVNPEHLQATTRKKLSKRSAQEHKYGSNLARNAKVAAAARARSSLTQEIVDQIRRAEGTQRAIAARFGVSQHTVCQIRRGLAWRDYTNPFMQLLQGGLR